MRNCKGKGGVNAPSWPLADLTSSETIFTKMKLAGVELRWHGLGGMKLVASRLRLFDMAKLNGTR